MNATILKRAMLLTALLLCCATILTAAPISRQKARQQASGFLAQKGIIMTSDFQSVSKKARQATSDEAYYYVFNMGNNSGFVVVSGDDAVPAILGYADEGTFDEDNLPENMESWLQGYADQLDWLKQHAGQAVKAPVLNEHSAVSPLLTSTWNQGSPYNNLCPLDGSSRSVTGCVATAMAQVLYYHKYPAQTTAAIPAYTTYKKEIEVASIGITTLDWSNMKDNYTGSETAAQKEAVAKLMQLCGASVEMDYTAGSSGAASSFVPLAFKNYFGYDAATRLIDRGDYMAREWDELIYNELANRRPVYYSGQSTGGGHAFVIDGYDKNGLYHVNWGWGGSSNGYFLLSILDPGNNSGIGASSSTDGYSYYQDAMIGAQPDTGQPYQEEVKMSIGGIQTEQTSITKNNNVFSLTAIVKSIYSMAEGTHTFDIGLGVFSTDGTLLYAENNGNVELASGWGFSQIGLTAKIPTLPDGVYQITATSRETGTDLWYKNIGGNQQFLTATISGNTMTLRNPTINLVGNMEVIGNLETGSLQTVMTTIQNNGTAYNDVLYLRVNDDVVGGRYFEVDTDDTDILEMSFTPTAAGSTSLALGYTTWEYDQTAEQWNEIFHTVASTTVTITGAMSHNLSFSNGSIVNAEGTTINDNTAKIQVTVTNNDSYSYDDVIRTYCFMPSEGNYWRSVSTVDTPVELASGESKVINIDAPLTISGRYWFIIVYKTEGAIISVNDARRYDPLYNYTVNIPTIALYDENGTQTMGVAATTFTVSDNILAVDLSASTEVSTVVPNSNPNTVYIVGETIPNGLDGHNVVQNDTAELLTLTDGYGFFVPYDIIAQQAIYTRQFTTGADGHNGWSTIVLPFEVTEVRAGNDVIDWFHSNDDTGKNFWVKAFARDESGTVYFDYTNEMTYNTPYIIAVPGSRWGENWNLTNRDISFCGDRVVIHSNAHVAVNGNFYTFNGSTRTTAVTNSYVLNAEGNAFNLTTGSIEPFRAWFTPTTTSGRLSEQLTMGVEQDPVISSIRENLMPQSTSSTMRDLQGRAVNRPTRKGIYILDSKKIIIDK
ncbi:MAG: C10 family peptidase [Prevotella sp.]|nr:C10 family peptidase [Prevotella sp.]